MCISLCMVVKDEEKNLRNLAEAVQYINELIIVDTGSTDNTVEIAEKYGAKVKQIPWRNDFALARNEAINMATQEWILILDADEVLYVEDGKKLKEFLSTEHVTDVDGLILTVCNFIEPNNKVSSEKNKSLRLFRNNKKIKYKGRVHEQVINYTKIKEIPLTIYHYGYLKSEIIRKNKNDRNRKLLIKSLEDDPQNKFYLYHLAINNFSNDKYNEAIEIIKKIIPLFNGTEAYAPRAYKCLIMSYKLLNEFDEMLKVVDEAIEKWPKYTDLYYLKAIGFYHTVQYGRAINQLKKCLELGEAVNFDSHNGVGSTRALLLMANIYSELGDINMAIKVMTDLVKVLPNNPSVYIRYCDLLLKKNKNAEVEKLLISYCNQHKQLTDEIIKELYINRRFNLIVYLINNLKNIGLDSALMFANACSFTQRHELAIKNFISIRCKFGEDTANKITRSIYYNLWCLKKVDEANQLADKYTKKNSNKLEAKVFQILHGALNNNEVDIENLFISFSKELVKVQVLEFVKELEPYNEANFIKYLTPYFSLLNIKAYDLISIFDKRPIPDCLVNLYISEKELSPLYKYKRFISLAENRTQTLYDFLIKEGKDLIDSGVIIVGIYSKLALCYEIKANTIRRDILE